LSAHAQERLQFATFFRSTISCFVPEILAIKLPSCPKLAPNFDVLGPPIFSMSKFGDDPRATSALKKNREMTKSANQNKVKVKAE